jgi:adenosylcobinamide-phosphate synthase
MFEIIVGWPKWLFDLVGHPVSWIGSLIQMFDNRLNRTTLPKNALRSRGAVVVALVCSIAVLPIIFLLIAFDDSFIAPVGTILCGAILTTPLLATMSLRRHVVAVVDCLRNEDISASRVELKKIVSRDTTRLNEEQICSGVIETLAENTSDAVIAPLFWSLLLGVPGLFFYKAVNTMDSMLGYRNERYENFGKCAARFDDILNWLPARLTGLGFCLLTGKRSMLALSGMYKEAPSHRSPNAGWPESASAYALGVRLGGPRLYEGEGMDARYLNSNGEEATLSACSSALRLYDRFIYLVVVALLIPVVLPLSNHW